MNSRLLLFTLATCALAFFFVAFIIFFGKTKFFTVKNSFVLIGWFFLGGIALLLYSLVLLKST